MELFFNNVLDFIKIPPIVVFVFLLIQCYTNKQKLPKKVENDFSFFVPKNGKNLSYFYKLLSSYNFFRNIFHLSKCFPNKDSKKK